VEHPLAPAFLFRTRQPGPAAAAAARSQDITRLTGTVSFTLRTFRMDITGISGRKVVTAYVK